MTQSGTPQTIRAGDTTIWTRSFSDYPASTWGLVYYFRRDGAKNVELTGVASGDDFTFTLTSSTSGQFVQGEWDWYARATDSTRQTITVGTGCVTILGDPDAERPATHAEQMLAAVQAVQLQRAGKGYNASDIAGTSMSHKTDAELHQSERGLLARVKSERRARRALESGQPSRTGRIWVR